MAPRRTLSSTPVDTQTREAFGRQPFPAARGVVDRATRGDTFIGCLLFALVFVAALASVAALLVGVVFYDVSAAWFAPAIVVVILVSAIPWVVHMVRSGRRTVAALDRIPCPQCQGPMVTSIDGDTNTYLLMCGPCRMVWDTGVHGPGSSDHHDHHHHHV